MKVLGMIEQLTEALKSKGLYGPGLSLTENETFVAFHTLGAFGPEFAANEVIAMRVSRLNRQGVAK